MDTLQQALEHATRVYGAPIVAKSHPDRKECNAVYFGEIDVKGKHNTEFVISGDGRIVYYRRQGMGVKLFDCRDFVHRHQRVVDRMAEYAEQFTVRKPSPKPDTRETMHRYQRRFSTGLRWLAALHPPLITTDALNVLYAAHSAQVGDTRALMAGAI